MADKPTNIYPDPYRDPLAEPDMPLSADPLANDAARDNARLRDVGLDNELQVDPELNEGRASGGRVALYAIAVLVVLGAVIYGLNSSNTNTASNPPPATAAQNTPPPLTNPPNTAPGVTTGSAPRPAMPNTNNGSAPSNTVAPSGRSNQ